MALGQRAPSAATAHLASHPVLVTNGCADPLYLGIAVDGYTIGAGTPVSVERADTGASNWLASDRTYGSADAGTIDLVTPTTIVGAGCPER